MHYFKTFCTFLLFLYFQEFSLAQIQDSSRSQLKITLETGYRSLKDFVPERSASTEFGNCGDCTTSMSRKDSPEVGQGAYLQGTFYIKRIFIPVQLGILQWNDNFEGVLRETRHHPKAPSWWGPITDYTEYSINYKSISQYFHYSYGIGFNFFQSGYKFHLGPVVRITSQKLLSRKEVSNTVQKRYRKYQNPLSMPEAYQNIETFSNSNNAEDFVDFKTPLRNGNIFHAVSGSAGISSSGVLFKSFGYSIETGYQLQNFSRVSLGEIEQRSSFYLQFGILYQIK